MSPVADVTMKTSEHWAQVSTLLVYNKFLTDFFVLSHLDWNDTTIHITRCMYLTSSGGTVNYFFAFSYFVLNKGKTGYSLSIWHAVVLQSIIYKICISQNKTTFRKHRFHMSKRATCFYLGYVIVKLTILKYILTYLLHGAESFLRS